MQFSESKEKKCPFCAELIPYNEKKCSYCNEYIEIQDNDKILINKINSLSNKYSFVLLLFVVVILIGIYFIYDLNEKSEKNRMLIESKERELIVYKENLRQEIEKNNNEKIKKENEEKGFYVEQLNYGSFFYKVKNTLGESNSEIIINSGFFKNDKLYTYNINYYSKRYNLNVKYVSMVVQTNMIMRIFLCEETPEKGRQILSLY